VNFFSSVIFMCFCAAQEHRILLNKMIFLKWNQSFYQRWKLWFKTHRRKENTCIIEFFCDWKRTGARKTHTLLNFFSSVIFMCFCTAQERRILLNKMIFLKWNQSFYQRWKLWFKTHRRKENTYIIEFFFQVWLSCVFARRKNTGFC